MDSEVKKRLDAVLHFLSFRPRSRREIERYLVGKHTPLDQQTEILTWLETHRFIDDQAFAQWLVSSRSRSRPRGNRLLQQELKAKGITSPLISASISGQDERALAVASLAKKLHLWQKQPQREFKAKAGRFLASRGFSWSVIEEVVRQVYNDIHVN